MADDNDTGQNGAPPPPGPAAGKPNANETLAQAIAGLSNIYASAAKDGAVSPQMTDAITQALLLILGSAPSIAAYDSLLSVQQANGIMYHNAVAQQQKTNLLGMAMAAKCVRYMLDPVSDGSTLDAIVEEI